MISTTLCNSNCNQITLRSNYLHDLLFTAACTHYAAMTALCAAMTVLQCAAMTALCAAMTAVLSLP